MSDRQRELVEVRAVSMYPTQWAIVRQFSVDQGYGSTSAALRRIVDEWHQIKSARSGIAQGPASRNPAQHDHRA